MRSFLPSSWVMLVLICVLIGEAAASGPATIDNAGRRLSSLFEGLSPVSSAGFPSLNEPRLIPKKCIDLERDASLSERLWKPDKGRVVVPGTCPPPNDCSGTCICSEPIGEQCCATTYDFHYDCGKCANTGVRDVYVWCNNACCWTAYSCYN